MEENTDFFKEEKNRKELLIVDDVKLFLQLTKTLFSHEEYIINTAVSGLQAIEIARAQIPDLIILDLVMPDLEGDEVCRLIRSEPATRHIPVIMVSSRFDEETRRRCLYAGCDDFMTKPVRIDVLHQAVEKQLGTFHRSYPRIDVELPCILDNGRDQLFTSIRTLSSGGAYVETDPPPLPGSESQLTFFLPSDEDCVSLKARARWNRLTPGRRPPGSGFEFMGPGDESLERLTRWTKSLGNYLSFC